MSHFTVMVYGENAEEKLAPFDENIETEEHEQGFVTSEDKERFMEYYLVNNPEDKDYSFEDLYRKHGGDWNSFAWKIDEATGKWMEYSTYNPDSKWDWYQLGGRWNGFFKKKLTTRLVDAMVGQPGLMTEEAPDGMADSLLKKDIDIEFMRKDKEDYASNVYDKAIEIFEKHGREYVSWKDVKIENYDERREFYNNQPLVKTFTNARDTFGFFCDIDDFKVSKEEYLKTTRNGALTTYAFITDDGEWVEKGTMGWWGMSSDEMTDNEWANKFNEYFDSMPDNIRVSVYDCHI
jgi:hypothetical protein